MDFDAFEIIEILDFCEVEIGEICDTPIASKLFNFKTAVEFAEIGSMKLIEIIEG